MLENLLDQRAYWASRDFDRHRNFRFESSGDSQLENWWQANCPVCWQVNHQWWYSASDNCHCNDTVWHSHRLTSIFKFRRNYPDGPMESIHVANFIGQLAASKIAYQGAGHRLVSFEEPEKCPLKARWRTCKVQTQNSESRPVRCTRRTLLQTAFSLSGKQITESNQNFLIKKLFEQTG